MRDRYWPMPFYHSDIDYVVLEARNEIAPQVGASIAILPNGARILDQLGGFDHLYSMVEPLNMGLTWTEDGKNIFNSDSPILAGFRFVCFGCNRRIDADMVFLVWDTL